MISQQKQAMRKEMFAQRKAARQHEDQGLANARLTSALRQMAQGTIAAGYMPIRTEIDPRPAMTELAAKLTWAVPVITNEAQPLLWHQWAPNMAMQEGPFGALVPVEKHPLHPSLLICPLVAFDKQGYRLGYGGGFYDRSIEALDRPLTIGFAFDAQEVDAVPREATDQRLDAIITPTRLLAFSKRMTQMVADRAQAR